MGVSLPGEITPVESLSPSPLPSAYQLGIWRSRMLDFFVYRTLAYQLTVNPGKSEIASVATHISFPHWFHPCDITLAQFAYSVSACTVLTSSLLIVGHRRFAISCSHVNREWTIQHTNLKTVTLLYPYQYFPSQDCHATPEILKKRRRKNPESL